MEYGAMIPSLKVVYMTSRSLDFMNNWITEYSTVTPLELVKRTAGERPGHWELVS